MSVPSIAQPALERFLISDCRDAAVAKLGASGARLVGVLSPSIVLPGPTGGTNAGMDLTEGKAALWIYVVGNAAGDSAAAYPFVRIMGSCSDQLFPPGMFDDVASNADASAQLPPTFIEGAALITALNGNSRYAEFRQAHPDSLPTATAISVVEEPTPNVPVGSAAWALVFQGLGPVDPEDPSTLPFTCIVNATSGSVFCFSGDDASSVADDARERGFALAPNPASEEAALIVPPTWVGRSIDVDLVDMTGIARPLTRALPVLSTSTLMDLRSFAQGSYLIVVRSGGESVTLPISVQR
jgi:hypothetical protein